MLYLIMVAPHAGAWIETYSYQALIVSQLVAPHAGAWIETQGNHSKSAINYVAPHAGAWIETDNHQEPLHALLCRSPCGSVD